MLENECSILLIASASPVVILVAGRCIKYGKYDEGKEEERRKMECLYGALCKKKNNQEHCRKYRHHQAQTEK